MMIQQQHLDFYVRRHTPPATPRVPTPQYRAAVHQETRDRFAQTSDPRGPIDEWRLARIDALLREFIRSLGEGSRFFAQDFCNHLQLSHPDLYHDLDMRRTSGLYRQLLKEGVIQHDGYAPNGGGPRANSTPRSRYVIARLPHPSESSIP